MKLYMKTSDDEYRLPIGVCSYAEINRIHGKSALYVANSSNQPNCLKWEAVVIDQEEKKEWDIKEKATIRH